MSTFPGALFPGILQQFTNAGLVGAGWKLHFLETGTVTEKDTFATADLDPMSVNANPVVLDAYGRAPIFFEPGGYDIEVLDENDVLQFTREKVEDVGLTFLSQIGLTFATGATNVNSGYTVLASDQFVTVDSTGGASPCLINLPPADDRSEASGLALPLGIKNLGTEPLSIVPDGSDTIETIAAAFTVPAASSPTFPTIWLVSDGVSGWYIVASHGL